MIVTFKFICLIYLYHCVAYSFVALHFGYCRRMKGYFHLCHCYFSFNKGITFMPKVDFQASSAGEHVLWKVADIIFVCHTKEGASRDGIIVSIPHLLSSDFILNFFLRRRSI